MRSKDKKAIFKTPYASGSLRKGTTLKYELERYSKTEKKKIKKLKYLSGDVITNEMTRNLWVGNSFLVVREKLNEIIDWINSQ